MRTVHRRGSRGQVLVIFALAAVVLFGIGALAIDAGVGQADRRHLQEASDAAALAAARTSGTAAAQNYVAMLYLERDLGWSALPSGCSSVTTCPAQTYTAGNYTVTIGNSSAGIDVSVNHARDPILGGILGFKSTSTAGSHETAGTGSRALTPQAGGPFGYALYSQTTVSTGNQLEEVDGDVYVGTTLSTQSKGQAGFCTKATAASGGHIVFGSPLAFTGTIQYSTACAANGGGGLLSAAPASGSCSGTSGTVAWQSGPPGLCLANPSINPPTYTAPTTTGTIPACTVSSATLAAGFYDVPYATCPSFTIDFGKDGYNLSCVSFLIEPGVAVAINGGDTATNAITAYGATGQTPACAGASGAAAVSNRFVFYQPQYTPTVATPQTTFSVQGPGCCPTYNLTGEVYTPSAAWSMTTNAQVADTGQLVVYAFDDQSGSHPNPLVTYDPNQVASTLSGGGLRR